MINEESKKRLVEAIFFTSDDSEISEEEIELAHNLIDAHPDLTERDRKIIKLKIYRNLKYREITELLELEKSHTAQSRYNYSIGKIRKSLSLARRPDDGTEQLSNLIKNRRDLRALNLSQIYTIGQMTDHLKEYGKLNDSNCTSLRAALIIYSLDQNGYDLRKFVTDQDILKDFEELDRRNYLHVNQLQTLIENQDFIDRVERITNTYKILSKTEFGSFDIFQSNGSKIRLRATINSLEDRYDLSAEIESSEEFEAFSYSKKMTHSVSTNSKNLENALEFLLAHSSL